MYLFYFIFINRYNTISKLRYIFFKFFTIIFKKLGLFFLIYVFLYLI